MEEKVRVFEIAEEAGSTSAEVIKKAANLGIALKSPQSVTSFEEAEEIAGYLMTGKSKLLKPKKTKQTSPIIKKPKEQIKPIENTSRRNFPKMPLKRNELRIVSKKRNQTPSEQSHSAFSTEAHKSNTIRNSTKVVIPIKEEQEVKTIDNDIPVIPVIKSAPLVVTNHTSNKERATFIVNSFPEITIKIENLKTINTLEWKLQSEKGLYAIIGENGAGKSSLLISIAKLIDPTIFHLELTGIGYYDNTKITYTISDKTFTWIKNKTTNNNWRQSPQDKLTMPKKLKGFFESSIISGKRFSKIDEYIKEKMIIRDDDSVVPASKFIQDEMNYILYGKKQSAYKFNNLFHISAHRNSSDYEYFALKLSNDLYIKEHLLSTGEYFLLKLLKYIDEYQNNKGSIIPAIIIIDEVELSLHPLAQIRLTEQLKKLAHSCNLIILFASHSLHVLENISEENTYYIEKNVHNVHIISNPVYRGYLSTRLYKHTFHDKVILVEDDLASQYVTHTLEDMNYNKNLSIGIIPIGGDTQVVNAAKSNYHTKFYGHADVMVALDEDAKKKAYGHNKEIKWKHHIPVDFNIENFIGKLIIEDDYDFGKFVESRLTNINYDDLNISTTKQKTGFKTLCAEMATYTMHQYQDNKIIAIDIAKKELVKYTYNYFKKSVAHSEFVTEITKLLNRE